MILTRSALALTSALALALALTTPALADEGDCLGYGSLADKPDIALARIGKDAPRTYFVKNASDAKGCPAATEACRDKSYLVPGDRVIASRTQGRFICVDFIGAKGADRTGWLPAAAITREVQPPVALADWTGTWSQVESKVTIKPGRKRGELAIHGDATFGTLEPDRVKRGAINVGEINGDVTPDGAELSFAMGEKATLPVDKGDEFTCKVWMRRLGPYLLVDDNKQCGGNNVSFGGAYTRGR